jgi:mono/diheme cytochrome c family protein
MNHSPRCARLAAKRSATRRAPLRVAAKWGFALASLLLAGCSQQMAQHAGYKPLARDDFFADHRASRPLIEGTVARGQLRTDSALFTGKGEDGKDVTEFPFEMTADVLARGKQRYEIFCSVCHGLTGQGDGRIVQRGFTRPPSYSADPSRAVRIRTGKDVPLIDMPVGHFFDVITRGFGAMPDLNEQIPVRDRWAIVGYVRALQISQSPELRARLTKEKGGDK